MAAEQLANLKMHSPPKTIVSDWGSIFISQVTKELNKRLRIWLNPSTDHHSRTDGESDISKKAVEKYVHIFTQYY